MFRTKIAVLIIGFAVSIAEPAFAAETIAESTQNDRPRIGLVLGGGGARGAAHIGVLKELERMRIPVDAIAGTSMGAIIGGLYATGMNADELESLVSSMDWAAALSDKPARKDLSFRRKQDDREYPINLELGLRGTDFVLPQGVIQGQKLDLLLRDLTSRASHVRDFDDLPIPFRAIASDIVAGEAVVLARGDLSQAIRASMSVPGVFTPASIGGRLLVDGGLIGNLPIDVMRSMGVDIVIAVDVEVGHRHPFGIEEPLEQERVAQGIEVGDRQRIGHERASTRATAWPHRNVVILGPFDEIGDDQEVTGKAHALDDAQFEFKAFVIVFAGGGGFDHGKAGLKAFLCLTTQLLDLVIGELGQDRIAALGGIGTAACDFQSVFKGLGQIGEKRRHLGRSLEIVLLGQFPPVGLLIDIGPLGNADQRIVGLVHLGIGEIDIVGRHQGQLHGIGHFDHRTLRQALGLGQGPRLGRVALQFDVKAVGKDLGKPRHQRLGLLTPPCPAKPPNRTIRPPGQADQPVRVPGQFIDRDMGPIGLAQVEARVQLHQALIARAILRQKHQRCWRQWLFARGGFDIGQIDLAADNRLDARANGGHGKLKGREHIVRVGHGDGGHPGLFTKTGQLFQPHGPFKKRVFGVKAEVDETGSAAHGLTLERRAPKGKTRVTWPRTFRQKPA